MMIIGWILTISIKNPINFEVFKSYEIYKNSKAFESSEASQDIH